MGTRTSRVARIGAGTSWLAAVVWLLSWSIVGCPEATDNASDQGSSADITSTDLQVDPLTRTDSDDVSDEPDGEIDAAPTDVIDETADVDIPDTPDIPDFSVGPPFERSVPNPLNGTGVESCAVYLEEQCVEGALRRCTVYDPAARSFVSELDPLLERVLLFERWYELYHAPNGQTAERGFNTPIGPGRPEAAWGDPDLFTRYIGAGDAAIWTGAALNAFILRYLVTGTEADYERMENKVRDLLRLFDVTGIPGYLARNHFLLVAAEAPTTDQIIVEHGDAGLDHRDYPIPNPETIDGLPPIYFDGIDDGDRVWTGEPMWHGNPSIDQYTGPMVTFPAAFALLRDEDLKSRLAEHMTCYLRRLRRLELINLQDSPEVLDAVQAFFGGGGLNLDPDDIDFRQLDTVIAYYLEQPNSANERTFDRTCPESIALEPTRLLDASDSMFPLEMAALALDLQSRDNVRAGGIDHIYVPSVRGGDAVHMMHLAAMSYYFTGNEMYADFLRDELLGSLGAADVADTMGALIPPPWCRSYYGDHITFSPLWAFINLLDDSPLRTRLHHAMRDETWEKIGFDLGNAKLNLMYAGVVPPVIAGVSTDPVESAIESVRNIGGNGGVLNDPRRGYTRSYDEIVALMPLSMTPVCPTEQQRATCETPISVFGLEIPAEPITHECADRPEECPMEGDVCAWSMASGPLPVQARKWSDFIWQRNPYAIGEYHGSEGTRQSPGLDVIEPYWLARYYGFIEEGEGQVLAWEDAGSCE